MAKKNVAFILDRSGSMASIWDEVVGGYKHFVEERQKEGDVKFTLVAFDNEYEVIHDKKPISEVSSNLGDNNISPRGSTALLDAVGKAINSLGKTKKAMVVIFTDGLENASHEFKKSQIKELIDKKQKAGWGFVFMGADQDAFAESVQFGMMRGQTVSFQSGIKGSSLGSIAAASTATADYFNTGSYEVPETFVPDEDSSKTPTTP